MYENAHIQTFAVDFSRRLEQDPSISRTLVRLNIQHVIKTQNKTIS